MHRLKDIIIIKIPYKKDIHIYSAVTNTSILTILLGILNHFSYAMKMDTNHSDNQRKAFANPPH